MSKRPKNSLRKRLNRINMLVTCIALLLSIAAFIVYDWIGYREARVRAVATQADVVGYNCASALLFHDENSAASTLAALKAEPHIVSAAVYNKQGALFATYVRSASDAAFSGPALLPPTSDLIRFDGKRLVESRRIWFDNEAVGSIYIESDWDEVFARLEQYLVAGAAVLVASMLVALGISSRLQLALTAPILNLADTAGIIAREKDYSVRASLDGAGEEIDLLTNCFNQMLAQIQHRDRVLAQERAGVERQVEARTAQLQESEERYRLLFDQVPLPMFVYDRETLRFLAVNKAAVAHYGYSSEEFAGKTLGEIRPPDEVPALGEYLHEIRSKEFAARVTTHRKKDGTLFDAEVHSYRSHFLGRPATIVLAMDVTERKRTEERIRVLNADLEARLAELAASNKDLEAFTYSVSHDLRSPLRHIDGFSRILEEEIGPRLDGSAKRYLQRIREGTQQMGTLVDDLLNLSRIGRQEVRRQATGLSSLVQEVRADLQKDTAGRDVEWRVGPLPFADCDPILLKQVFTNLLSNAVKYTRPRERALIEVGALGQNGETAVFVRDNGVGFSMKYADKLFGVFQRLHRQEDFEGTGVGLATVQRIIQKHGGRIWAEAELDRGACFYFTLNIADKPAHDSPMHPAAMTET